jgi:hypothetical protein
LFYLSYMLLSSINNNNNINFPVREFKQPGLR